ncbi:isocitrate lyase/phosphoenolpyruvate mutase family protein [Streptomyces sp. JJ66]|uniref:isocitrate lyase/PEP mutase family protein n=1 Tax=Streptomyces sp. JJ66 TaxID=2803843 RepID=UPI001C573404|nr:isocitrate lyase/phosphoenolpyruvate mutase family protein [Streptomyces sp. JJ66]MBW1601714.1 isocitrate lyase/phosphoenolpyruvate mutase family protein [Streptomyces sp. JJ66]
MGNVGHTDTARRFTELHDSGIFVLANAWDAGTARLLADAGFAALGTTSAGLAHTLGRPDGVNAVTRDEALASAAAIAAATELPVSADLESGFGRTPQEVAETIRRAGAAGLAGGSVEDSTGDPHAPVRPLEEAVERVAAAAEAARSLDAPFVLTARAENYLYERPDLDDTVRRLRAFEAAGADVLFAPGLPDADAVRTVVGAVSRPVNVLMGDAAPPLTLADLAALGVRRVSLGSALSRTAINAVRAAARRVLDHGRFDFGETPTGAS